MFLYAQWYVFIMNKANVLFQALLSGSLQINICILSDAV